MNIAVCVKMVSELQFVDSLNENREVRLLSGSLVINPADEHALEIALNIKEDAPDTCITVLTMGPRSADRVLTDCLARGADRAYHIFDPVYAGSDTLITAKAICRALNLIGPFDIILCGNKTIDSETGHIGPQIGALLGMITATNIESVDAFEKDRITFTRLQDDGLKRFVAILPLIMTVRNSTSKIRIPTIASRQAAMKKEIITLTHADLDKDGGIPASPTTVIKYEQVVYRKRKCIVEDSPQQAVVEIGRFLVKNGRQEKGAHV
jgi:electron transfer flavoprotein beta subunit